MSLEARKWSIIDKRHTGSYIGLMSFNWNEEKNELLKSERGISFERIVVAIEEGHLLDVVDHPNSEKYKNQKILIVDIEGYAICVPFVEELNGDLFLKTLFPSRKHTKQFNLEGRNEQE